MIPNDVAAPRRQINPDVVFHRVDVLFLTALFEERGKVELNVDQIFRAALHQLNTAADGNVRYELVDLQSNMADMAHGLRRWNLQKIVNGVSDPNPITFGLATLPQMGNVYSALYTQQIIERRVVGLSVLVGICGSADENHLRLGDVLVSTEIHWVNVHKLSNGPDPKYAEYKIWNRGQFKTETQWQNIIRNHFGGHETHLPSNWDDAPYKPPPLKAKEPPRPPQRVEFGPLVATNHVVDNKDIRDLHKRDSKALGIEMESGGMFAAIALHNTLAFNKKQPPVHGMVFKGVSDLCAQKNDDVWREIAGYNAAFAALSFVFSNMELIETEILMRPRAIPEDASEPVIAA